MINKVLSAMLQEFYGLFMFTNFCYKFIVTLLSLVFAKAVAIKLKFVGVRQMKDHVGQVPLIDGKSIFTGLLATNLSKFI